ncbi:MAG: hypothetical protein KZQ85_08395 [Candidatus Thiodiazotropha sp. (ex Myrtea sp. 'scaly one' KF741663)]|nr:hypothetical protein [Candidatus Thiodiazotropha sp. (ex Myrtea sp. 'scaly one' KF741663)]
MAKTVCILMFLVIPNLVFAVDESPRGKVTGYYTGWGADAVRVTIEGATYIEGNCATKDGYMTVESDNTGYKTHTSALLSAYMSGKEVKVIVEGCISSRPKIWGVYIY